MSGMYRASVDYGRAKTAFDVTITKYAALALLAWGGYVALVSKKVPDWVQARAKTTTKTTMTPSTFAAGLACFGGCMLVMALASRSLASRSNAFSAFYAI